MESPIRSLCNSPSLFSEIDDLLYDPVMSSPIHDEVDASDLGVDAETGTELLLKLDPDLLGEVFLNSSCALSPSETLSPNHDFDSGMEDPLGLMNDILREDNQAIIQALNFGSRPLFRVDTDTGRKQKVGGGKNIEAAARKIIKVYPTQVPKSPTSNRDSKMMMEKHDQSFDKCMNRSAINARENRERKKKYISNLENNVKQLTTENKALTEKLSSTDVRIAKLEKELKYTRSILANQSPLANILGGLLKTSPGLQIRAPLLGPFPTTSDVVMIEEKSLDEPEKESASEEYKPEEPAKRYPKRKRNPPKAKDFPPMKFSKTSHANTTTNSHEMDHSYNKKNTAAGGICLHISHDDVSLQMCADCSGSAQQSLPDGH